MFLTETILRIRQACPIFQQRVAGTQSFVAATSENSDIDVPCCFVVPMSDTAQGRTTAGSSQAVTERFATIICADNSKDARNGRGLAAETVLKLGRQALVNALFNWTPITLPYMDGVSYARSQHLFMNNARIWHQYEWTGTYRLAPNDDAPADPAYDAIEKILRGYFPEVDPRKVRQVLTNAGPGVTIQPDEDTSYETVYRAMSDVNPEWIRFRDNTARPPSKDDPGNVLYHGERRIDP